MFKHSSWLVLGLYLLIAACNQTDIEKQQTELQTKYAEADAKLQKDIVDKMKAGLIREIKYYPQPDFSSERMFKVEDQYGCRWWISSGHKFDRSYPVLKQDKETVDCNDPKNAPEKTSIVVDKSGNEYRP